MKCVNYVITFTPRVGSTWLSRLMASHFQCTNVGEFLNEKHEKDWTNVKHTLYNRVFPTFGWHHAAGGKVAYYQTCRYPWQRGVWKEIVDNPQVRIVHLERRNKLRQHLSRLRKAKLGGSSKISDPAARPTMPILVNTEDFFAYAERRKKEHEELRDSCRDHPSIDAFYEDLLEDRVRETNRICKHLSIGQDVPMVATMVRIHTGTLPELIENYEEVERALKGTEWEFCLE